MGKKKRFRHLSFFGGEGGGKGEGRSGGSGLMFPITYE
jgi:hypothetical protein